MNKVLRFLQKFNYVVNSICVLFLDKKTCCFNIVKINYNAFAQNLHKNAKNYDLFVHFWTIWVFFVITMKK